MAETKKQNTKVSEKINQKTLPTAIALIVMGILFCIFRSSMLNILFTVVGVVMVILGIVKLINKVYAMGAVDMAIGIIVIACGWTILDITLLVIGIVAIVYGVYAIFSSIPDIKSAKGFNKFLVILIPCIIILVGILLVVAKWQLSDAIFITLGIFAVLDGLAILIKK